MTSFIIERFQWKPGTVWNSKWKPHLVLYISGAQHIPSQLNKVIYILY